MKSSLLKLPVGVDSFEKIRKDGFYYVDKTTLIEQLLEQWGEVNLFTRPRRFGKTLNMSMLRCFFDIGADRSLFDGLDISKNQELCDTYMGRFPVLFFSLKNVDGLTFADAKYRLTELVAAEAERFLFLSDSKKLSENEKSRYQALIALDHGRYTMDETILVSSLQLLSQLLYRHYGQKTIILIDEYDVPLDKAFQHGYYKEMVSLIRGVFGQALKTNDALQFAVLTGCLRVSKESIFTGLNNFKVLSITDARFDEQFGFTEQEVSELLETYHLEEHQAETKEWYDGYHMGEIDVYCPWDVMNYLRELQRNPKAQPVSYWKNTSDNAIIRSFIDFAGNSITDKMETLLSGGYILQDIDENLTYDYLHSSESNLWSILYMTGYLTEARISEGKTAFSPDTKALKIPNAEIREIFETTVMKWFADSVKKWNRTAIFQALWNQKPEIITREMNLLLWNTISYHDYKEDFYHAFLTGIFMGAGEQIESNKEHGLGRPDLVIIDKVNGKVAIFEVKYSQSMKQLNKDCDKALVQMKERKYAEDYKDRYKDIFCYGISFYKKECLVKMLES